MMYYFIFHMILSRKPIIMMSITESKSMDYIMKVINTIVLIVFHFVTVAAQNTLIKTVNISTGAKATLTCDWPDESFQGFQRISWKRRNEVLLTCTVIQDCNTEPRTHTILNDSFSVSSQESPLKSTLTIPNVSATDSLYTCSITTFDFGQECVFNINITGKKIDEKCVMLQGCFEGIVIMWWETSPQFI